LRLAANAAHADAVKMRVPPSRSAVSRTATMPAAFAVSTHSPPPLLL